MSNTDACPCGSGEKLAGACREIAEVGIASDRAARHKQVFSLGLGLVLWLAVYAILARAADWFTYRCYWPCRGDSI